MFYRENAFDMFLRANLIYTIKNDVYQMNYFKESTVLKCLFKDVT